MGKFVITLKLFHLLTTSSVLRLDSIDLSRVPFHEHVLLQSLRSLDQALVEDQWVHQVQMVVL